MSMSAPAITARAFWNCSDSLVGPLAVSPNHSMFQLAMSRVVAEPLAGTACAKAGVVRHKESKSTEIVVAESVLLIHIPFMVEVGRALDRVEPWSVCRIARQSRQLSDVNIARRFDY